VEKEDFLACGGAGGALGLDCGEECVGGLLYLIVGGGGWLGGDGAATTAAASFWFG